MITVKVVKDGYGHKPGQVMTLSEFDAGHLMSFGYAVNYEPPKPELKIETQMVAPPEVRVNAFIDKRPDPVKLVVEPEPKPLGIFRRGRQRNKKV